MARFKGGTSIDRKYVKLRLPKSKFGKKKTPVVGRLTFFQKDWDQLTQDMHNMQMLKL